MATNKTIIRYLTLAKACIRLAIETTANDDLLGARAHLKLARHWLARANLLIMRRHITQCLPKIIGERSNDEIVDEVMKTYRYAHA